MEAEQSSKPKFVVLKHANKKYEVDLSDGADTNYDNLSGPSHYAWQIGVLWQNPPPDIPENGLEDPLNDINTRYYLPLLVDQSLNNTLFLIRRDLKYAKDNPPKRKPRLDAPHEYWLNEFVSRENRPEGVGPFEDTARISPLGPSSAMPELIPSNAADNRSEAPSSNHDYVIIDAQTNNEVPALSPANTAVASISQEGHPSHRASGADITMSDVDTVEPGTTTSRNAANTGFAPYEIRDETGSMENLLFSFAAREEPANAPSSRRD